MFVKGIYLKQHKKCSVKSFGKNPHENYISCCVLYLFHNIKKWIFFFWSVLRSLTSSLESDERATSIISCFSHRKHQLMELFLWCSYQCTLSQPHFSVKVWIWSCHLTCGEWVMLFQKYPCQLSVIISGNISFSSCLILSNNSISIHSQSHLCCLFSAYSALLQFFILVQLFPILVPFGKLI